MIIILFVCFQDSGDSSNFQFSGEREREREYPQKSATDDNDEDDVLVSGGGRSVAGDINPRKLHRLRPTGSRSSRTCV